MKFPPHSAKRTCFELLPFAVREIRTLRGVFYEKNILVSTTDKTAQKTNIKNATGNA